MRVLVTGGAGFIGSHLTDRLVRRGDEVIVLDNLDAQVHTTREPVNLRIDPETRQALATGALRFVHGDVCDAEVVRSILDDGIEAVVHLAAAVGVGQSMYKPSYYTSTNVAGQGVLMEEMVQRLGTLRRFVVASSMSLYGEGAYRCACRPDEVLDPTWGRDPADLERHFFEFRCPHCGQTAQPAPTPESKSLHATSIYALTKKQQEELALCFGDAYDVPTIALRFFNVFGSRQSLANPYTGAAAIFMARLKNGKSPIVFEDGHQTRDFIHVHDIADAIVASVHAAAAVSGTYNVCTGEAISILQLARRLAEAMGRPDIEPEVVRRFRQGDIRSCVGDPAKAARELGWCRTRSLRDGLDELLAWASGQAATDRSQEATAELQRWGLVR